MRKLPRDLEDFEAKASGVADILAVLANQRRLMVLCELWRTGGTSVNALADAVGLSQSALSQHLAKMREQGLVTFDREGQTLRYRVADARLGSLLATLYDLYCKE